MRLQASPESLATFWNPRFPGQISSQLAIAEELTGNVISFDGAKVTMYAQWRTIEDYQAMRNNPASRGYLQQVLAIARFEPGMYEIVESYLPDNNGT